MPDMQQAIKELQETVIVMSGIQERQAALLKDHAEWLHAHDLAMARRDKEMAEARLRLASRSAGRANKIPCPAR